MAPVSHGMADYHLILKRAIAREPALQAATPEGMQGRAAIYAKARAALDRQLASLDPAPAEDQVARVRASLDDAVARLEAEYGPAVQPEPGTPEPEAPELIPPPTMATPAPVETPTSAPQAPEASPVGRASTRPGFDAAEMPARPVAETKPTPPPVPNRMSPPLTEPEPDLAIAPDADLDAEPGFVGEVEVEPDTDWSAPPPRARKLADRVRTGPAARRKGSADETGGRADASRAERKAARKSGTKNGAGAEAGALPAALARRQRGRGAWPVAVALLLIALVVAGVGVWQRDALMAAVRAPEEIVEATPAPAPAVKNFERVTAEGVTSRPDAATPSATEVAGAATAATGAIAAGQGASGAVRQVGDPATAVITQPASAPATAATPAEPALAGDGTAILYEERLLAKDEGDRFSGSVSWTAEREPDARGAEQTVLRGLIQVPARDLDVLLTVRRNEDETLPASHTIELLFETGDEFAPGGVANVMGILMKPIDEAKLGQPLKGASARITDGYFLIGLSSLAQDEVENIALLQDEPRLEIPILYNNGQRAILELRKGPDGATAFAEAFGAWAG